MTGRELLERLKAAGYAVDVCGNGGAGLRQCRITQAGVRRAVGNRKWKPTGLDHFDGGVFKFWVNPPQARRQ